MTITMMEQFGVQVIRQTETTFLIPAGQYYKARDYQIELLCKEERESNNSPIGRFFICSEELMW